MAFRKAYSGPRSTGSSVCATGREPDTSGADNLKTYALSEASYASAASGQTVDPRDFA